MRCRTLAARAASCGWAAAAARQCRTHGPAGAAQLAHNCLIVHPRRLLPTRVAYVLLVLQAAAVRMLVASCVLPLLMKQVGRTAAAALVAAVPVTAALGAAAAAMACCVARAVRSAAAKLAARLRPAQKKTQATTQLSGPHRAGRVLPQSSHVR